MQKRLLKNAKTAFKKQKRLFKKEKDFFLKQKCKIGFFKSEKTLLKKEKDFFLKQKASRSAAAGLDKNIRSSVTAGLFQKFLVPNLCGYRHRYIDTDRFHRYIVVR